MRRITKPMICVLPKFLITATAFRTISTNNHNNKQVDDNDAETKRSEITTPASIDILPKMPIRYMSSPKVKDAESSHSSSSVQVINAIVDSLPSPQLVAALLNSNATNPSRSLVKNFTREWGRMATTHVPTPSPSLLQLMPKTASALLALLSKPQNEVVFQDLVSKRALCLLSVNRSKGNRSTAHTPSATPIFVMSPADELDLLCSLLKLNLIPFHHTGHCLRTVSTQCMPTHYYREAVWRALYQSSSNNTSANSSGTEAFAQFLTVLEGLNSAWYTAINSPAGDRLMVELFLLGADLLDFDKGHLGFSRLPCWTSGLNAMQLLFTQLEINKLLDTANQWNARRKTATAGVDDGESLALSDVVQLLCFSTKVFVTMADQQVQLSDPCQKSTTDDNKSLLEGILKIDVEFLITTSINAIHSCLQLLEARFVLVKHTSSSHQEAAILAFRHLLSPTDILVLCGVGVSLRRVAMAAFGSNQLVHLEAVVDSSFTTPLAANNMSKASLSSDDTSSSGLLAKAQSLLSRFSEVAGRGDKSAATTRIESNIAGITLKKLTYRHSQKAHQPLLLYQALAELCIIPALSQNDGALWNNSKRRQNENVSVSLNRLSLKSLQQAATVVALSSIAPASSPTALKYAVDCVLLHRSRLLSQLTTTNVPQVGSTIDQSVFEAFALFIATSPNHKTSYDLTQFQIAVASNPSAVRKLLTFASSVGFCSLEGKSDDTLLRIVLRRITVCFQRDDDGSINKSFRLERSRKEVSESILAFHIDRGEPKLYHLAFQSQLLIVVAWLINQHLADTPKDVVDRLVGKILPLLESSASRIKAEPTLAGAKQLLSLAYFAGRCLEVQTQLSDNAKENDKLCVASAFISAKEALEFVRNERSQQENIDHEKSIARFSAGSIISFSRVEQKAQVEWLLSYLKS